MPSPEPQYSLTTTTDAFIVESEFSEVPARTERERAYKRLAREHAVQAVAFSQVMDFGMHLQAQVEATTTGIHSQGVQQINQSKGVASSKEDQAAIDQFAAVRKAHLANTLNAMADGATRGIGKLCAQSLEIPEEPQPVEKPRRFFGLLPG